MAETARTPEPDTDPIPVPEPKPALLLVRDTAGIDLPGDADVPDVVHRAVIGYAIGFVAATALVTIVGVFVGLGFVDALGLGVFVGVWGGGGFGFMMGGTLPLARHFDAQSASGSVTRQP